MRVPLILSSSLDVPLDRRGLLEWFPIAGRARTFAQSGKQAIGSEPAAERVFLWLIVFRLWLGLFHAAGDESSRINLYRQHRNSVEAFDRTGDCGGDVREEISQPGDFPVAYAGGFTLQRLPFPLCQLQHERRIRGPHNFMGVLIIGFFSPAVTHRTHGENAVGLQINEAGHLHGRAIHTQRQP